MREDIEKFTENLRTMREARRSVAADPLAHETTWNLPHDKERAVKMIAEADALTFVIGALNLILQRHSK